MSAYRETISRCRKQPQTKTIHGEQKKYFRYS